jgi:hypothetical protein
MYKRSRQIFKTSPSKLGARGARGVFVSEEGAGRGGRLRRLPAPVRWEVLLGGSGLDVSETWRTLRGVRHPVFLHTKAKAVLSATG